MTHRLTRLLQPKSIAVFGGGWTERVVEQCLRMGFQGDIWPGHPKKEQIAGLPSFASIDDLPCAPDASFVGVNRQATIDIVGGLAQMGAGGPSVSPLGSARCATEKVWSNSCPSPPGLIAGAIRLGSFVFSRGEGYIALLGFINEGRSHDFIANRYKPIRRGAD